MATDYEFDAKKNQWLKDNRGIGFDEIISLIGEGCLLAVLDHPNPSRYPHQKVFVVDVEGYTYLIPFEEKADRYFLRTIYPSRKMTKVFLTERKK
jgi:hypothetical protein